MKKRISIALIIASLILILDTFNAGQALVTFLLTGTIPGTSITLSASLMLMLYALVAGFIGARVAGSIKRPNLNTAAR